VSVVVYINIGDGMKSYLKIILGALLVGSICAYLFYKNIVNEVDEVIYLENKVYVFQVGVFKNKDNAINYEKNYLSKKIYYDEEYYRVFIGITSDKENKEKLKKIFANLNYSFYIKEYKSNENKITELNKYEILLKETNNLEVINKINQEMLNIFY